MNIQMAVSSHKFLFSYIIDEIDMQRMSFEEQDDFDRDPFLSLLELYEVRFVLSLL